jgi:hypothetical protein
VVTLSVDPIVPRATNVSAPVSEYFIAQPDGYSATYPASISVTTVIGTGVSPALGGSTPAAGANVASSGGLSPSGSFGSASFDPLTTRSYPDSSGVSVWTGYTFLVTTTFSPGMSSAGATAVLYSDTGSPTWVGTVVPINGYFRLDPSVFTVGDVVRVKVTPAAPSAHLIGYSNEVSFRNAGISIKRVSRTSALFSSNTVTAVVGTTNYIWFVTTPPSFGGVRLFRMHKSTEVVDQAVNINGYVTSDNISILGAISDTVFFLSNNTSAVLKMYSVNESLTVTQVSNHTNNNATADTFLVLPPVRTASGAAIENFEGTTFKFNSCLYYYANNINGFRKLYKVNGSGTITQVSNTRGNQSQHDVTSAAASVEFNGALWTVMGNAGGFEKLFKINTSDVITAVGDTRNSAAASDNAAIRGATTNFLYYISSNSSNLSKGYRVDTSDVPLQIINFSGVQTTADSVGNNFAIFNNCYYFFGRVGVALATYKVYKVDDAGATLINVAAPLTKDGLGAVTENPAFQPAGSVLFFSTFGADNTSMLFYITASDVVTRSNFINIIGQTFGGAVTFGGRTFVLMTPRTDPTGLRALYEVLPTTFNLRQVAPVSHTNAGSGDQFTMSGHISGSNYWVPMLWGGNSLTFVVKVALT